MSDPKRFESVETLKNGVSVRIRAVRTDDKQRLAEAFQNLAAESIYTRFFHHKRTLTDDDLRSATEVDFDNVVALVVTVGEGPAETIVAGARYVTMPSQAGSREAEVAFLVEEDFHGQGIAGRLLRHLAAIARAKGVSRFHAEVLPQNKAMLTVFTRCGFPVAKHTADGVMQITIDLSQRPS